MNWSIIFYYLIKNLFCHFFLVILRAQNLKLPRKHTVKDQVDTQEQRRKSMSCINCSLIYVFHC